MTALRKANEVRIARAKLKRQIRDGDARIEQILATPPPCVCTATVLELLLAVPKIGPARAGRLLAAARLSQTKIVGTLSERQRAHLIDLLPNQSGG
jgi:transposase